MEDFAMKKIITYIFLSTLTKKDCFSNPQQYQ